MDELTTIPKLAILALPLIFAITVHEAAHGWVADRLGDNTARSFGRITLNPLKHIDLFGTLILPAAMFALTGFMFGWAKPVPINPRNLHRPRRDMALVAVAGPVANLIMALLWALAALVAVRLLQTYPAIGIPLVFMGAAGVFINVLLMALNLLPVPPLDGGRVVTGLLPENLAAVFMKLEPFGLPIMILLLVSGILSWFLAPIMLATIDLLPASSIVSTVFPLRAQ